MRLVHLFDKRDTVIRTVSDWTALRNKHKFRVFIVFNFFLVFLFFYLWYFRPSVVFFMLLFVCFTTCCLPRSRNYTHMGSTSCVFREVISYSNFFLIICEFMASLEFSTSLSWFLRIVQYSFILSLYILIPLWTSWNHIRFYSIGLCV